MMQIWICDDDARFCQEIQTFVIQIMADCCTEAWVTAYTDGGKLQAALEKECPDILLLDIDMPRLGGYELAGYIQENGLDTILIFLSGQEQLVFQAFEYRPFRFVRKSGYRLELRLALDKALEQWRKKRDTRLAVQADGETWMLLRSEIRFVQMENRRLHFHMAHREGPRVRLTVKELEQRLQDERFIRINSGCVVNSAYVEGVSQSEITLTTGERLAISRPRAKEVHFKLRKYWG